MEKYRPLSIGGGWIEPESGEKGTVINPSTGEIIAEYAIGGAADINKAGCEQGKPFILIVPPEWQFSATADVVNRETIDGVDIRGIIMKNDDGVLVSNRLNSTIPVIDEVREIDRIPEGLLCAVEVAPKGRSISVLSDPFGISDVLGLDEEQTKKIAHVARALIGIRSAVVIKTPAGDIKERVIPAGDILISSRNGKTYKVPVESGAKAIMDCAGKSCEITDVTGTRGTSVGGMFENVRCSMADLTGQDIGSIKIEDIMAIDTIVPREVTGNLAREISLEKAVGIASMVRTNRLNMEQIAAEITKRTGIPVKTGGIEGRMAAIGAKTTPGTGYPLLIVDIGAGSTDACLLYEDGETKITHLAGAGDMVTMTIRDETGITSWDEAEKIKKYPLAKVETLFSIRHEDDTIEFFEEPFDSSLFARIVILDPTGWQPVSSKKDMRELRKIRRAAKERVLITNVFRALKKISLTGSVTEFDSLLLVGGSAVDFELGNMITEELIYQGIVSGKANVRRIEGPRNAVATGLLLAYLKEEGYAE